MVMWKAAVMVSVDFYRIATPLLTPNGVSNFLVCWSLHFARGKRKSAPLGLGDRARRTSSSQKDGAQSGGESYLEMATEFLNAVRVRPCFFYTVGSVRPFPWFF